MINNFDYSKFIKFSTSSGIENNCVGNYEGRIIRVFKDNIDLYKEILSFANNIPGIIKSNIYFENETLLAVEHEKLDYITYYSEWTKRQKVAAAISIIKIQQELSNKDFFLSDPHSFNITFKYAEPVYFDFGSIKKGKVKPFIWFLKNFCGLFTMDYWDSVLKIGIIGKIIISIRMLISRSPYDYLFKKIEKYNTNFFEKSISLLIRSFPKLLKALKIISKKVPILNSYLTNWSDYEQKEPSLLNTSPRVNNFIAMIKKYSPKTILDIGANKGAYSKLALSLGTEKAVCADLDETSLNFLLDEIKLNRFPIWTVKLDIIDYDEKPGCYGTYEPVYKRIHSDFCICLAVVHHICYFGNTSFADLAERLYRFSDKILVIEFIPYDDIHLKGPYYKGKDRTWYTTENFIHAMKIYFHKAHEIFESEPSPRILIKFEK